MVYLEAAIQGFSLKEPFVLGTPGEFPWGLLSVKAADCMSIVLVDKGSFGGVSQGFSLFYYLLGEGRLWGNCH